MMGQHHMTSVMCAIPTLNIFNFLDKKLKVVLQAILIHI
jgi:hypothetical protein